jgi:hypothetical protein
LPIAPRCERPRDVVERRSGDQPGGLAQGPEEKKGRAGGALGRSTKITLLTESTRRVGTAWPAAALAGGGRMTRWREGIAAETDSHVKRHLNDALK